MTGMGGARLPGERRSGARRLPPIVILGSLPLLAAVWACAGDRLRAAAIGPAALYRPQTVEPATVHDRASPGKKLMG